MKWPISREIHRVRQNLFNVLENTINYSPPQLPHLSTLPAHLDMIEPADSPESLRT